MKFKGNISSLGCVFVLLLLFLVCFWTDRNLDFWISHFKGEQVDCPFWLSCVVTLAGNGVILLANIIAEIAKFAL